MLQKTKKTLVYYTEEEKVKVTFNILALCSFKFYKHSVHVL